MTYSGQNPEPGASPVPVVRRDGTIPVRRIGGKWSGMRDLFHFFMRARWAVLILAVVLLYTGTFLFFAVLYTLGGDTIMGARPGNFADAFFFSVHTLSTIGYGSMTPKGNYANALVAVEAVCGHLITALSMGLFFAKFSRPTSRVLFSNTMVVFEEEGVPMLVFRLANERGTSIVEAQVKLSVLLDELDAHGKPMRRFYPMALKRDSSPVFALSWLVFHPMNEASPLYGLSPEALKEKNATFFSTMTGLDDTLVATVHSRKAWSINDLRWRHRFQDILTIQHDGTRELDYRKFHETEPL